MKGTEGLHMWKQETLWQMHYMRSNELLNKDKVCGTFVQRESDFIPGGSDGKKKKSSSNVGDLGSIPGSGRSPGEGNGYPLQYSCLENSTEQRNLVGYSPWGRKERDTTEQLSTHI